MLTMEQIKELFAVSYARVSTEDQARKELSVPAQFRRIDDFSDKNNITIVYRDADEGVSAYGDTENRDGFIRAVEYACKDPRVTLFMIDDTERFYRDKYLSGETKARLRRHGVWVLITSDPYDPRTIEGVWRESIGDALAQTSSMKTAFYTFRGMEENIKKRDPVTGWCFKNGGTAPFGYKAVHVVRGQDSRGRNIIKTLWEIDEEAAEVKRFMFNKRAEGESKKAIWRMLNQNKMLSPSPGKAWTISSIFEMMREERVLQDAGWAIWNKEDHGTKGKRFKDKSKWVHVENAHPAIISFELAKKVIEINQSAGKDYSERRAGASPFLLTGKNDFKEDMFVCLECGARMTGLKASKRHRPEYICGSVRYRGAQS
jgi:DNA invertase Pin-like site-specific DNA recombinase